MSDANQFDVIGTKLVAGTLGAVVSLRFIQGTKVERALMFLGAVATSYFGTEWVSSRLDMAGSEGLVGLLLGLYSMPLVSKVYESINLIDTQMLAEKIGERFKRIFGG